MDPLASLTGAGPTELVRLARAAVAGLVATLEAGRDSAPGDPAVGLCSAACDHLRGLLDPKVDRPALEAPARDRLSAPPPAPRETSGWLGLRDQWIKSREWSEWVGNLTLPNDTDLPRRLWLLTLRMPPEPAREWQSRWLRQSGAPEETAGTIVPGPVDLLLVPPIAGECGGVRMSPTVIPDSRVGGSHLGEIAGRLALVVSGLLWFMDHDPGLRHSLRVISRFGSAAITGSHRTRYQQALTDRLEAVHRAEAESDTSGLILAWIDLDEAIHSLVFDPLPHTQSGFAQLGRAGRETLGSARDRSTSNGQSVHIQVLGGRYADCVGLTDSDADLETASGASPGDVARCLRVFMRLNGTAYPGRVMYRPR